MLLVASTPALASDPVSDVIAISLALQAEAFCKSSVFHPAAIAVASAPLAVGFWTPWLPVKAPFLPPHQRAPPADDSPVQSSMDRRV